MKLGLGFRAALQALHHRRRRIGVATLLRSGGYGLFLGIGDRIAARELGQRTDDILVIPEVWGVALLATSRHLIPSLYLEVLAGVGLA